MSLVSPEEWNPQGIDYMEQRAWEALRLTSQSVLVTAGAGAGKTEFLAQKAAYLLQTGICAYPKRILAISFKRDAARNLAERVAKRCTPEQARRFDSYTFDAFSKSLLDRFRAAIPAPYSPAVDYSIDMPRSRDYREFLHNRGYFNISEKRFEEGIAQLKLPIASEEAELHQAVAQYWYTQYQGNDHVSLSFHMVNRLVGYLFRANPYICKALQLTYPFVFLDEFQDTTYSQYDLLCTAFNESDTIFTAVGDDKQRIMVWAGAMPDAFDLFERQFGAQRISLLSNWRSHEDLVRIQHIIAHRIDPNVEIPQARAERTVDGEVAAIWKFNNCEAQREYLAQWIENEIAIGRIRPCDIAILVRMHADDVEIQLAPAFEEHGLRLRNVSRMMGETSIQDLLNEDLTKILLRLLRLGVSDRNPEVWSAAMQDLQYLEAIDSYDDVGMRQLQNRLQAFKRELHLRLQNLEPVPDAANEIASIALDFVGASVLRRAYPNYQRQTDFERIWNSFLLLLRECLEYAETWSDALDEFEGLNQITLMTIHKSKGLEFHTMIFCGLDNQSWWSLQPNRVEELSSFFVAFTRARQRAFFTMCFDHGAPVTWIEELLSPAGMTCRNLP